MQSLVTDATPYKQGLRESLDFGSFLSANRTPNVRVGSNCDLQHPLKHRRLSARNETFGAECRQSARNRTFTRGSARVRVVPESDIARVEQASPLSGEPTADQFPLSGSVETFRM